MSESILAVQNVQVRRGRTQILRAIDWEIRPGEHWVILGANGSGKTSLLNVLTGYLMPTQGMISVLGCRFGKSDWRALRQRIGYVSSSIRQLMAETEPALDSVVSGKYAMIDFWGRPTAQDRAAARQILRRVGCLHLAERPWSVLSQGERQRILIGRALMAKPALLILDEPCAGLDPVAREKFLQFIQRLGSRKRGPALVLVTHHVEEIMPAFTHVLALRAGKLQAAGPVAEVLTSNQLSRLFGAPMKLRKTGDRYGLSVSVTGRQAS